MRFLFIIRLVFAVLQIGIAVLLVLRSQSPFESIVIALLLLILIQVSDNVDHDREDDIKRRLIRIHALIRGAGALSVSEYKEYKKAEEEDNNKRDLAKVDAWVALVRVSVQIIVGLVAVFVLVKAALDL